MTREEFEALAESAGSVTVGALRRAVNELLLTPEAEWQDQAAAEVGARIKRALELQSVLVSAEAAATWNERRAVARRETPLGGTFGVPVQYSLPTQLTYRCSINARTVLWLAGVGVKQEHLMVDLSRIAWDEQLLPLIAITGDQGCIRHPMIQQYHGRADAAKTAGVRLPTWGGSGAATCGWLTSITPRLSAYRGAVKQLDRATAKELVEEAWTFFSVPRRSDAVARPSIWLCPVSVDEGDFPAFKALVAQALSHTSYQTAAETRRLMDLAADDVSILATQDRVAK